MVRNHLRPADRWEDPLLAVWRALRPPSWVSPSHAVLLAILAAAFGFYAQTLGYWFFFDDFWFLRASQSTPFGSYALNAFNYRQPGPIVPEFLYRPLNLVTFWCFYQVFGLHAWPYHLLNIAFHLAGGVLLWKIAVKITGRPMVGHLATLIFLLYPTYEVAVAWVANGNVVMSTFACLSSLWLFLRYLDGGASRRVYYIASFLAFVAALLLHPETAYLAALPVLSYLLLRTTSLAELRSVRAWAQFIPFFVMEIGFLVVQALAREANAFQSRFALGPHMLDNYARYTALALDPYRAPPNISPFARDLVPITGWRTLLPLASGLAAGTALLFFERRRPHAGTFALLWFILAVLPLSTWTEGAFARKLYGAGPGLALAVAIFAVSSLDLVTARLQTAVRYLAPCTLLLLVTILMGARVLEMTGPFGSYTDEYRTLVEDARASYPTLPEGSRLYLAGVPWPMLIYGPDSAGLASAMRLYYGDIEIFAVADHGQLEQLPHPPRANDAVVRYHCPPVCQPPSR